MTTGNSTWDKILLLAACAGIMIAGIVSIVVGATGPNKGLIAYGVAAIIIALLGFIYAIKGKPDVGVTGPPNVGINRIGGLLDVPWWIWLIDVGLLVIAAIIANTALA